MTPPTAPSGWGGWGSKGGIPQDCFVYYTKLSYKQSSVLLSNSQSCSSFRPSGAASSKLIHTRGQAPVHSPHTQTALKTKFRIN